MPTLNESGSTEVANVSALGWRSRAMRMNSVMQAMENEYISSATMKTKISEKGIAPSSAEMPANTSAIATKMGGSAFMPKRVSTQPPARLETRQIAP